MTNKNIDHKPVLIQEVLECLKPRAGQSYLDLTAGYGGHTAAVLTVTDAPDKAVLVDRDEQAAAVLKRKFGKNGARIIQTDFLSALDKLTQQNRKFDMILADLGLSSPHLEDSRRGFSFRLPGPLDMRMDQRHANSAEEIVNQLSVTELEQLLRDYGQEPKAGAIARAIVASRPVKDTAQLATIITEAVGWRGRRSKIHPATRSFQAIRIAVNDELAQLEKSLPVMAELLNPEGRLAIISFHSLEDRIVKRYFADHASKTYDATLSLLTKKPLQASRTEIVSNPRARSAKLRAVAKIKR